MTTPVFWSLFAAAIVAVLAVVYGIGWGLTDCPRWFLRCQCRTNLPGPDLSMPAPGAGEHQWSPPIRDTQNPGFWTDENYAKLDGPDAWDAWNQRDPDQAADQLIAEWHDEPSAARYSQDRRDTFDEWWAGLDGLERECMLVHDWLVREERLWAELKAETRELCAA